MLIVDAPGPHVDRSVTLQFYGDWGLANLSRVCGWLQQEFLDRAGPDSRAAIWNGRGGVDAIRAVGRGEVDVALSTPAPFARMGLDGLGPFAGEAYPELRALGVVPQNDRLLVALDEGLGISSFPEWREQRAGLRIAACPDDGINFVGLATEALMSASGIDRETVESWGGNYVFDERPPPCVRRYIDGEVDAVIMEAMMMPAWDELFERRPTALLEPEPAVLADLESRLGWPSYRVPEDYWPAKPDPIVALDFSDFLVIVRSDLPEDVAHLLTWCLFETTDHIEMYYRHLPPNRSPISYPLEPEAMARTPIPLHPGAVRYLDERSREGTG